MSDIRTWLGDLPNGGAPLRFGLRTVFPFPAYRFHGRDAQDIVDETTPVQRPLFWVPPRAHPQVQARYRVLHQACWASLLVTLDAESLCHNHLLLTLWRMHVDLGWRNWLLVQAHPRPAAVLAQRLSARTGVVASLRASLLAGPQGPRAPWTRRQKAFLQRCFEHTARGFWGEAGPGDLLDSFYVEPLLLSHRFRFIDSVQPWLEATPAPAGPLDAI